MKSQIKINTLDTAENPLIEKNIESGSEEPNTIFTSSFHEFQGPQTLKQ